MERIVDIVLILVGCALSLAAPGGPASAVGALGDAGAAAAVAGDAPRSVAAWLLPDVGVLAVAPVSFLLVAVIVVFGCEWASTRWRVFGPLAYCALASLFPDGLFMLPAVVYELCRFVCESLPWRAAPLAALMPVASAMAVHHMPLAPLLVAMALSMLAALCSLRTSALLAQRALCHRTCDDLRGRELSGADGHAKDDKVQQEPCCYGGNATVPLASVDAEGGCRDAFSQLTDREYEVVRLIAEGLDNHEIAVAAFISEGTVRNRISSVLQKTGCKNRTQLAVAWWQART